MTRSPSSPMCCVLTARTGRTSPDPGRALPSKAPAGRSSSPARQASAFGNGFGRQSKSLIEIRPNPIAFGSFTPADRAPGSVNAGSVGVGSKGGSIANAEQRVLIGIRLSSTAPGGGIVFVDVNAPLLSDRRRAPLDPTGKRATAL